MRVAFVNRRLLPEGGVSLAGFRLATALVEAGHGATVLYGAGEPPVDPHGVGRRLGAEADGGVEPARLARELEALAPDLVIVGSGRLGDLRAGAAVAPTVLHAHMHYGVCADNSRYWAYLRRPCSVRAGWRCAVLRPLLGCSGLGHSLDPGAVVNQRQLLAELVGGELGIVCVSSDQAELFSRHGVAAEKLAVLPNLGIRTSAAELAAASRETPQEWRGATAFFGRLSKAKGGQLLPALAAALPAEARFRVFGEGYLGDRLASLPPGVLCGHISQEAVVGVLMWARAAVFPSLWPEPGGIVGVDAQVLGVPLGAFDVGAARHWPAAERFPLGAVTELATWLAAQQPRRAPRDPEQAAAAQRRYWQRIGELSAATLSAFAAQRRFAPTAGAPVEELIA